MKKTRNAIVSWPLVALLLSACAGCPACDNDGNENNNACPDSGAQERFRVATFNGGLARGDVENVDERAPAVIAAVAALDVELVCVQEFWLDWDALAAAAATRFPNSERLPAMEDCPQPACSPDDVGPLAACAAAACPGLSGMELAGCASSSCGDQLAALPPGCASCVIDNVGSGLEGIQATCVSAEVGAGTSYLYNCEYDTGILTNAPIVAQESIALDSYLVAASVNYVRVETPVGQLDVFCTHLASNISTFEYNGDHGSYKEEQAAQIDQLLAYIDQKNDGSVPVVVLGDLNTGPAVPEAGIEAQWDDHYQELTSFGLSNPYAEQSDVACTVCRDNTFSSDTATEKLIDHVLVRDYPGQTNGARAMTDTVHIEVDGQDVETHPSDHYGQVLTLTPASTCE